MTMTIDEALVRYNFLTKLVMKDGDNTLTSDLKVKLMKMRIDLLKFKKEFDEYTQTVTAEVKSPEFDELAQKQDKTEKEVETLEKMTQEINESYQKLIQSKLREEVEVESTFTAEEFSELLVVNSGKEEFEINGNKLQAADFLEVIYTLFVA